MHYCSDFFSADYFFQVTYRIHVKNDNRQIIFFAHASSGQVHYFQTTFQNFIIGDVAEFGCSAVFLGVGSLNAIYTGTFQHNVRFDFYSS